MIIKPTYFVSFPRSGHHWTTGMIFRYFGDTIHYCETYTQPELRMNAHPATNLEKTHDFDLNVDPAGRQALVLCRRDVFAAMRSWYRWLQATEDFYEFLAAKQLYWLRFLARWTLPVRPDERRIVFWYEDVKANPVAFLAAVAQFMCDDPVDMERIVAAVKPGIHWDLMTESACCPKRTPHSRR